MMNNDVLIPDMKVVLDNKQPPPQYLPPLPGTISGHGRKKNKTKLSQIRRQKEERRKHNARLKREAEKQHKSTGHRSLRPNRHKGVK
jgi:hypothetical protein